MTGFFGAPLTKCFKLLNLQFYNEFNENKRAYSPLWQDEGYLIHKYFWGSAFELDLGSQLSVVGIEMLWSDYYYNYYKHYPSYQRSVEGAGVWVGDETAVWADYPQQFFRLAGNFESHLFSWAVHIVRTQFLNPARKMTTFY